MKAILLPLVGVLMTGQAMAAQPAGTLSTVSAGDIISDYHYGMDLDIAKVVSHSDIPNVCHVVPAEMIYKDSQGELHTVHYRVMGSGCLNG